MSSRGTCSFQDFASLGSNFLGQASKQFEAGSAVAGSSFSSFSSVVKSGAKVVKSTIKENLAGPKAIHVFQDSRNGTERVVQEVQLLAEGGFGAVMLARESRTNTNFAVKIIACQQNCQIASTVEAAVREAEVLQKLPPHPNIVQCFGFINESSGGVGTVKLLLELCPSGHLLDFMDSKDGKLSGREVLAPMLEITAAVKHMHSQRPPIQHRDLKVENVLRAADGTWKLCDFGSCSTEVVPAQEFSKKRLMQLQEEIDKTVTMLYRPPEMADIELNARKGWDIYEQVDLWMCGCIMFTLLFYLHPFQDSANAMAIANAKYFIPVDHPNARNVKLVGVVHWLLAAHPKDRPTSKQLVEVLTDLPKCNYEDLEASMPSSVLEKIARNAKLFGARKDVDIPMDCCLPSERAERTSAPAARQGQAQSRAQAAPRDAGSNGFDLNFALSAGDAVAPPSRGYGGAAAGAPAAVAAPAPPRQVAAPAEDLLSFGSAAPVAVAPLSSGGGFDLLDFGSAPTPAAQVAQSPAASQSGGDLLDFGFGEPVPSAAAPLASQAEGGFAGCDFADFSQAPSMATVAPVYTGPLVGGCGGTPNARQQPSAQADLLDLFG